MMQQVEIGRRPAGLRDDGVARAAAVIFVLVLAPYFLPVLSEDQLWYWGNLYADLLLYGVALVATLAGLGRINSPRESRFWALIAFAIGAALLAQTVPAVIPATSWSPHWDLATESTYLLFYLGMALAVQVSRSDVTDTGVWRLTWLRNLGAGLLLTGLLVYFDLLPAAFRDDTRGLWYPALFMFAALDLVLAGLFLRARSETDDIRWMGILAGLALVMGAWGLVDLAEGILYIEPLSDWELSPYWDLLWYVPVGVLVVVARRAIAHPRSGPEVLVAPLHARTGPLFAYTLTLPIVHYLGYAVGVLDPALRDTRDVLVLVLLLVLGVLSLVYERSVKLQNQASNEELRTAQERYQSFLDTSAAGIYLFELSGPIPIDEPVEAQVVHIYAHAYCAEANDSMARMYGFQRGAEMVGKKLKDLHGGDDDPTNLEMLSSFVTSGYRHRNVESAEVDRDGNRKYFENSSVGVVEDGFLVRVWGTQVDVTERRQAEAEKRKLEAQLRQAQKMDTIGTLAGGIAHDFNNVLAPILGFAELAAELTRPEETVLRSHLDHVVRGTLRAQSMVSQILAVSRNQESQREPMLVQDVIADVLNLIRSSIPSTIRIETGIDPDCPAVFADPSQIHQVVMNLCTNARQAIGDSGGTMSVQLSHRDVKGPRGGPGIAPGKYVVLKVRDDGPGMDADIADKVFEPFFTTKGIQGGTGLGLSVVHGIVSGHDGDIRLNTAPGEGAEFVVYLPVTTRSAAPQREAVPTRAGAVANVLVVDDEKEVAAVAVAMLSSLGFAVTSFTDSEAALAAFRMEPAAYDVLFTDHTMPRVTGAELAREARALRPDIAVVVASGYQLADAPEFDGEFEQLGKPFTKNDLAEAVRKALAAVGSRAGPGRGKRKEARTP